MTDRELLELAAKAAGAAQKIDLSGQPTGIYGHPPEPGILRSNSGGWNPLVNDGDALRLAIQIGMQGYFGLEVQPTCVQATCLEPWEHCEYEEYKTQDPYAATRRAIVRAAALIGRSM